MCRMHASSRSQTPHGDGCYIVPEAGLRAGWWQITQSALLPDMLPCMHMSQGWEQRTSTPLLVHCMKSFPSCEKASSLTCSAMTNSQTIRHPGLGKYHQPNINAHCNGQLELCLPFSSGTAQINGRNAEVQA